MVCPDHIQSVSGNSVRFIGSILAYLIFFSPFTVKGCQDIIEFWFPYFYYFVILNLLIHLPPPSTIIMRKMYIRLFSFLRDN